jgi:CRISPR-associated endonuclease/helicase Cas3
MADLPPLEPNDFAAFFSAIHGNDPFPWQMRLARRLADGGAWPAVLDLPTGVGKTAAIDIAVFHLALQAGREDRVAPLRIVYVVDRRTIVDQAYTVATQIRDAIDAASDGVLAKVRTRLAGLSRDGVRAPLRTALLRGAIARSDLWARSPDQPLVAVSTVDQVGSRLLFRGYGVSDAMKPVHAGLLGNDVLYLLDEVHLSEPFRQTLGAIENRYGAWAERPIGRSIVTVEMSATPGRTDGGDVLRLDADDERHPILSRRLRATKRTTLKEVSDRQFVAEVEKTVRALIERPGATVGVVVNRVHSARKVHEGLRAIREEADVHLLTGRMRPLDREALERGVIDRIRSGRRRDPEQRSVVVVATQCIEAGADFDFDALVSECASLDALRQRFGRLDRLGALDGDARGAIIARTDSLRSDPIYGEALGATWRWLNAAARSAMSSSGTEGWGGPAVDFGIRGLEVPEDVASLGLIAPRPNAPVLLPSHLDAWVQTSPMPTPDPEVALWLHGPDRGVADVQIVWRADLSDDLLAHALDGEDSERVAAAREVALGIVDAMPPASAEAMPVPFVAAKRWLEGRPAPDVSDVEGSIDADEDDGEALKDTPEPRAALVWRGDSSQIVRADGVRPGDTLVVPAIYGGIASGTWAPDARKPIIDVAEIAAFRQRGRAILRLDRAVVAGVLGADAPDPPSPSNPDDEEADDRASVRRWLESIEVDRLSPEVAILVEILREESASRRLRIERVRLGIDDDKRESFLISARRRVTFDGNEVTTEDDRASFTGVAVPLGQHLGGVRDVTGDFMARLALPSDVAADLRLAGRWHDAGKVDPRFQRLLNGGSEFKTLTQREPLAKSALPVNDRRARHLAQARSGYPVGARHELMSTVLMVAAADALTPLANDWELVLHLVSSHHGRCRPFAPWVPDPNPVDVAWELDGVAVAASSAHDLARLDSGVGERFWRLVRRYGWWGLAWLEAILRLADHRRSEEEQRDGAGGVA